MGYGDIGKAREARIAIDMEHIKECLLECATRSSVFCTVDLRDQGNIFRCVDAREGRLGAFFLRDRTDQFLLRNEPVELRIGIPCHPPEICPHRPLVFLGEVAVLEPVERLPDPLVCFCGICFVECGTIWEHCEFPELCDTRDMVVLHGDCHYLP